MIYLPPNPEQDRARRVNSEITRAQIGIQMAKLRRASATGTGGLRGERLRSASVVNH